MTSPGRWRHVQASLALFALAPAAQAQGGEVAVSIALHVTSVIGCFIYLQLKVARRPRKLAMFSGLAAVVVSEIAVAQVPYQSNKMLITAICVLAPFVAIISTLALRRWWLRRSSGPARTA